jgi:hypothetical protein
MVYDVGKPATSATSLIANRLVGNIWFFAVFGGMKE